MEPAPSLVIDEPPPEERAHDAGETIAQRVTRRTKRMRGATGLSPADRPKPVPSVAPLELLIGPGVPEPDGIVCSVYWGEWCREAMLARVARPCREFAAVWRSLYFSGVYPPRDPGRRSAMRVCVMCGRDCPPTAVESEYCADCQENVNAREEDVGRLCDAGRTVERLMQYLPGVGVVEWLKEAAQLKAETDAALRKEIRRYQRGQWRPEGLSKGRRGRHRDE